MTFLAENQIVVMAADDDGRPWPRPWAETQLSRMRLSSKTLRWAPMASSSLRKKTPAAPLPLLRVVAEQVVGVLVADRDAEALVAAELVVLEQSVLDAPADEQAVAAVADRAVAAHDRVLGSAAGVQPEPAVVLAHAVLDGHALRDLETDAVAVVLADGAVADRDGLRTRRGRCRRRGSRPGIGTCRGCRRS